MLFQLFVGDAQFLALHLQFFGLTLGLLQHVLQAGAVAGRPQGRADGGSGFLQQGPRGLCDGVQEAQLEHHIDLAVGLARCDNQMSRIVAAQCRADGQIAVRHLVKNNGVPLAGDLTQQAFLGREAGRDGGIGGDPRDSQTAELAFLALEQGTRMGPRITGQKRQNIVREIFQRLVAQHGLGQTHLTLMQPFLTGALSYAAADELEDNDRQKRAKQPREHTADDGGAGGIFHLFDARLAHPLLFQLHLADNGAHGIHFSLAAIGVQVGDRAFNAAFATRIQRIVQLAHARSDMGAHLVQMRALDGVVLGERIQFRYLRFQSLDGALIGLEIGGVFREEIAALTRFRIQQGRHQAIDTDDDLVGVHYLLVVGPKDLNIHIGDDAGGAKKGQDQYQS